MSPWNVPWQKGYNMGGLGMLRRDKFLRVGTCSSYRTHHSKLLLAAMLLV